MEEVSVVITEPELVPGIEIDTSYATPTSDGQSEVHTFDLPSAPIEVVKTYQDWCVLSVTRGNGPRRVEEWILANKGSCFGETTSSVDEDSEGNMGQQDVHNDLSDSKSNVAPIAVPVTPVLANPHNATYAHSILLAPRDPDLLNKLTYLRVIVQCLVKGYHKPGSTIELEGTIVGRKCRTKATCLEVVPSNSIGHISLLLAYNDVQGSTHIAPRQFQRHFLAAGWPILGGTRDCYPYRGEKMCLTVIGLEFDANGIDRRQSISMPPVPKLHRVLEKEKRSWKEKHEMTDSFEKTDDDLVVSSEIPIPMEYVNESAIFDGLEFRVTRDCMIPRQGTVALVDLVESHFSKTEWLGEPPRILDLGTGCGNLLLSTLKRLSHLDAIGVGLDISPEALLVCDSNIEPLGLQDRATTIQGSFEDLQHHHHPNLDGHEKFDVILCNPPYIPKVGGRRKLDAVTMTYEPHGALFVNRESPNIHYEHVCEGLIKGKWFYPDAILIFEVCKENAEPISRLMCQHGFEHVEIGRDSRNCIRTVHGYYSVGIP